MTDQNTQITRRISQPGNAWTLVRGIRSAALTELFTSGPAASAVTLRVNSNMQPPEHGKLPESEN
jgi:hypothetical protein